ncbi:TetR family transcriptional regulator [Actibacterium mucosum KCTC 23349]|uniref:TetR family transcriptional regulator n=1 Tax=Actibacterium mucosum KCTC 23349 TaxID=1454373 RepID=A0A037ZFL8_9RHOB|nr:TetR/AcrR family transcriptional regulator [Actibacterium mucosum]KAJ55280.1 TetR family transcriptional regulator [Actibacterium mucosum KCTC 23349]
MRPSRRDELVRKAFHVFYRHGFHATGMDTLVRETGISKTTMYNYFSTKDELILAVLRLRDEEFRNRFTRRMQQLANTPAGQMLALFDVLDEWFHEEGFCGCLFIKAGAEFQDHSDPIHVQAAEHKRVLQEQFTAMAREAGARDPRDLASKLMVLKEGAIVLAVLGNKDEAIRNAKGAAQLLIETATGQQVEAA